MDSKKIVIITIIFVVIFFFSKNVIAENKSDDDFTLFFQEMSWTVSKDTDRALKKISSEYVIQFIRYLLTNADEGLMRGKGQLGEYLFVEMNKDKQYKLLATLDYSGRGFYSVLIAVNKTDDTFQFQELHAFNIKNLKDIIVDLNDDGEKEILITNLFGTYRGARPTASWTDVYKFDGKQYVLANEKFPQFYKKRIETLEKKISELNRKSNDISHKDAAYLSSDTYLERTAYLIELEKAKRLLNPGSKVGIERELAGENWTRT